MTTTATRTIAHAAAANPEEDCVPFEHAVALAVATKAEVVSVHASTDATDPAQLMSPRDVLDKAGSMVGIEHRKLVREDCEDPAGTSADMLAELKPDLVVLGTHQRTEVARWVLSSHADALVARLRAPTLIVPHGCKPFVHEGRIALAKVLVPAEDSSKAQVACAALTALLHDAGLPAGEVVVLHVGPKPLPVAELKLLSGWTSRSQHAQGNVPDTVRAAASDVDLIVMATHGQDSYMDAMVGTNTEQVFHGAPCPVLAVPLR